MTKMTSLSNVTTIGHLFVKQYYLKMHKDPEDLHRFYQDGSSFTHGGNELGSSETVYGQKEIHAKIISLDLSKVHARIKQVDSIPTLGNGIVIQVTGELSTHGQPVRQFVQTFVLAPKSENNWYIYNDIFRYQEEAYDATSESENNELQSDRGELSAVQYSPDQPATPPSFHQAPEPSTTKESEEEKGISWTGNGFTDQEPSGSETKVANEGYFSYSAVGEQPEETEEPSSPFKPKDPTPEPELTPPPASWAARVSKGTTFPSAAVQIPPAAVVQQPPRQLPKEPKPVKRPIDSVRSSSKEKSLSRAPISQGQAPDTHQIFIGGLPSSVTEAEVRETFGSFGNIVEVRLNPKNFGFVVFENSDSAQRILSMRGAKAFLIQSKPVNIEPKKSSGQKPLGGPSARKDGGFSSRSRGGGGGKGGKH